MLLNQAYFICPGCDERHRIYGDAAPFYKTAEKLGISVLGELPIRGAVNDKGNRGVPYILDDGAGDGDMGVSHVKMWREALDAACDKVTALHP